MVDLKTMIYCRDIQAIKTKLEEEQQNKCPKSNYDDALQSTLFCLKNLTDKGIEGAHKEKIEHSKEFKDYIEIAQALVDAGADVNRNIPDIGPLILMWVHLRNQHAVSFLLKNKAKINVMVGVGNSKIPLINFILNISDVAMKDRLELIELFLNAIKNDIHLYEPLYYLCMNGIEFNVPIAELLVKLQIDVNSFGTFSQSSLFSAIALKNHDAFDFLCKHGVNINLKDKLDVSPLTFALQYKNYSAAEKLVKAGAHLFSTPLDLIIHWQKENTPETRAFFKIFKEEESRVLQDKAYIEKLTLEDFNNIPVEYFRKNPSDILLKTKLIHLLKTSRLPEPWIKTMTCLLEDSDKHVIKLKNSHLVFFIAEFANILLHPELIDQKETNLCGPASLISLLMVKKPQELFDLAFTLVTKGKTQKPLTLSLSSYSSTKARSLIEILLVEIRRADNFTGYSPVSYRESIQGLTPPRSLVTWLQSFGFNDIEDSVQLSTTRQKAPSKAMHFMLDAFFLKFHSNKYRQVSKENDLKHLMEHIDQEKCAIVLVSPEWIDEKIGQRVSSLGTDIQHPSQQLSVLERLTQLCCHLSVDHYVLMTSLSCKEDTVSCELMTLGRKLFVTEQRSEFLKHFRGTIIAQSDLAHFKKAGEFTRLSQL